MIDALNTLFRLSLILEVIHSFPQLKMTNSVKQTAVISDKTSSYMLLSVNHALEGFKKIVDRVNFEAEFPNPQDISARICYTIL